MHLPQSADCVWKLISVLCCGTHCIVAKLTTLMMYQLLAESNNISHESIKQIAVHLSCIYQLVSMTQLDMGVTCVKLINRLTQLEDPGIRNKEKTHMYVPCSWLGNGTALTGSLCVPSCICGSVYFTCKGDSN